jgi:hypothetical protein
MKHLLIIIALFISGCAIQQPVKREYLSMLEIKYYYNLDSNQCRAIVKKAKTDTSFKFIYHAGRDQWMYDADFDYSTFKDSTANGLHAIFKK